MLKIIGLILVISSFISPLTYAHQGVDHRYKDIEVLAVVEGEFISLAEIKKTLKNDNQSQRIKLRARESYTLYIKTKKGKFSHDMYLPLNSTSLQHLNVIQTTHNSQQLNNLKPFDYRSIKTNFLYARLTPDKEGRIEAAIEITPISSININRELLSKQEVNDQNKYNKIIFFGFLIAFLTIAFINLLRSINSNSNLHLLYILMLLSNILIISVSESFFFQYVTPNNPALNNHVIPISAGISIATFTLFLNNLLETKKHLLLLNTISFWYVISVFLLSFSTFIFGNATAIKLVSIFSMLVTPLHFFVTCLSIKKKIPLAWYGFIATTVVVLAKCCIAMDTLNVSPLYAPRGSTLFMYLIILETFFFSMAAALQTKQTQKREETSRERSLSLLKLRVEQMEFISEVEKETLSLLETANKENLKLASVAHDLMQPVAAIKMACHNLKNTSENITQEELSILNTTIDNLEELITNLTQEAKEQSAYA